MQNRGVSAIICVFLLALSALPAIGVSPKAACEASIESQFKELRDLNAADTNVDGNVYRHYWGCPENAAAYDSCIKSVDKAWNDCVAQSGSGAMCSIEAEPKYYACANQDLSICESIVKQQECGSLSDEEISEAGTPVLEDTDTRSPRDVCMEQGLYYIDGNCYDRDDADLLCQAKYGERGYVDSTGTCQRCPSGYRFDLSEKKCVASQDCSKIANSHWDAQSQSCVCDEGYISIPSGGCQESKRKTASFRNLVGEIRFTAKAGRTATNVVDFIQISDAKSGSLFVKVASADAEEGILLKFKPLSQNVPPGQTKRFTITATVPDNLDPGKYSGTIRWSGYDNQYVYTGTTRVTVKVVPEDELFMPESEGQIIAEFSQARFEILPVLADKFHYGTEKRTRLNTILGSLDDKNPEDLQKMATIAGFIKEINFLANDNPFAVDDTEMLADALMSVAEHRSRLEAAHRKLREILAARRSG